MRQTFKGIVVSALNAKTVKVRIAFQTKHPKVLKTILLHKNYMAHDETNSLGPGDVVRIEACRPLSATKRFAVAELLQKSKISAGAPTAEQDPAEVAQTETQGSSR